MKRSYILCKLNDIQIGLHRLLEDFSSVDDIVKNFEADKYKPEYANIVQMLADKINSGNGLEESNDHIARAVAMGYGNEVKNVIRKEFNERRDDWEKDYKYFKGQREEDEKNRENLFFEMDIYNRIFKKIKKCEDKREQIKHRYEYERRKILIDYKKQNEKRRDAFDKSNEEFKEKIRDNVRKDLEHKNKESQRSSSVSVSNSNETKSLQSNRMYVLLGVIILILVALGLCLILGSNLINNIKNVFNKILSGQFDTELLSSLLKSVLSVAAIAAPICLALYIWKNYESTEVSSKEIPAASNNVPAEPLYTPKEINAKANAEAERQFKETFGDKKFNDVVKPVAEDFLKISEEYYKEIRKVLD